ncbi:hypothetical protein ACFL0H_02635 [Thermodesulfobacteriota bacterium]
MAPSGILIIRPEMPAMVNLLNFLKNPVFRLIEKEVKKLTEIHNSIRNIFRKSIPETPLQVVEILDHIVSEDVSIGEKIKAVVRKIQPMLILNTIAIGSPGDLTTVKSSCV